MFKKILILAVVLAFVSSAVFAFDTTARWYSGNADRERIVVDGVEVSVEGTLRYEAPFWYLDTANGSYELHLGSRNFMSESGIQLTEGSKCSVHGYRADDDIAVSNMTMDGKMYTFRDQNGMPLWASEGQKAQKSSRNRANTLGIGDGRQMQKAGRNRSNTPDSDRGRMMGSDRQSKRGFDQNGKPGLNRQGAGLDRYGNPGSGQGRGMSVDNVRRTSPGRGGQCDRSTRR